MAAVGQTCFGEPGVTRVALCHHFCLELSQTEFGNTSQLFYM